MRRASDAAYEAIKIWIQIRPRPPGALIDEAEAARRLSMSRTPVREALLRLQSEGFVEIGRGKGIRVLPLSASRHARHLSGDFRPGGRRRVAAGSPAPLARRLALSLTDATAEMEQALATGEVDRWGEADERFHRELMRLSGNP